MKRVIKFTTPPTVLANGTVGGYEETRGPIGKCLDLHDDSSRFGQPTWEDAEAEMQRLALNTALTKAGLSHSALDLLIGGDLENQCVATSRALIDFGVPFLGIYGACSTLTEGLLLLSLYLSHSGGTGAVVTSSHNSAAERQFRTPIEYGSQRTPTASWTATAAGSFILTSEKVQNRPIITEAMVGKMRDGATTDAANMGGAMAFAAADSIISYFKESEHTLSDTDLIVTGDLGSVGSAVLHEILKKQLPAAIPRHIDCGNILYNPSSDCHAGASGCGTSAAVLGAHLLPMLERREIKSLLLLSTGALMSPGSVGQGHSIIGIAPAVRIEISE